VQAGEPAYGGWPVAATRLYPDLAISGGGVGLRTQHLAVSVSPLHADSVRISFPDPVDVALPRLFPLNLFPLHFSAPDGTLAAPLQGAPYLTFDARALRVQADQPGGPPRVLTTGLWHLRIDPAPGRTALTLSTQAIVLPDPRPGEVLPLGPRLASLSFDATLQGDLDVARLDAATLAAWRDAGGGLEVQRLALGYGPLGLSGQGRLGLDGDLQPSGRVALQILGYAQTLQALIAAHVLTAAAGRAIGAVMSLLAHAPEGGGVPQVDTDVTLQQRTLGVAGYGLLKFPELIWPSGS